MSRKLRTSGARTETAKQKHKVEQKDKQAKQRQKRNFNTHRSARPLPTLLPGDKVWVKDRKEEVIID